MRGRGRWLQRSREARRGSLSDDVTILPKIVDDLSAVVGYGADLDDAMPQKATHMYRTAPLAGLWSHERGGFYHDGRFATLREVVDHYDELFKLGLTEREKADLVEYLKSL